MSGNKRTEALQTLLEPAVKAAGCELWGIEFISQGKHSVLRLFIDSENGITLDNCEAVSRQVSAVLDVEDPIKTEYNLEVSSPGLDRPLFTFDQFAQYLGEEIQVRLKMAVAGRRRFTARLEKADAEKQVLTFADKDETWEVSITQVDKANLVPVFD
ncbi:MAG: ribosome maturation factor RimP [Ketobacteraceae bacterium]|nr:ribosome maturation factor RimP [Ketobacteraceae bacterium]